MAKKETKKQTKVVKTKAKKEKIKKEGYLKKLRKELKLVKWPELKEVAKYTISTLVFCIFICIFFLGLNLIMAWIKEMFL